MSPAPITEEEIWQLINEAESRMSLAQSRLWQTIRVMPHKWQQEPYGTQSGGFWVVGLIGNTVLWYNEIEEGFNTSAYSVFGTIGEYWCNQDQLEHAVQGILSAIESGYIRSKLGAPVALK